MDGVLNPIEIKKGVASKDAVRNFSVLRAVEKEPREDDISPGKGHIKAKIGTGAVICMTQDIIPIDKKNWYIPAWII